MKTLNLFALSTVLVSASFAAQATTEFAADVVELAPVVVEATRVSSAADLTQASLNELKAEATNAPARLPVPAVTAPAPTRDGKRFTARALEAARTEPSSFGKPALHATHASL